MKKNLLLSVGLLMLTASAALAQNGTITVTVDASNGSFAGTGNFHQKYTSTAENGIVLSCPANNMTSASTNLKLYSGTAGRTSTYTITAKNPDYYVCEYSFSAQATNNSSQTLSIMGRTATSVSTTEATTFSSNTIAEGTAATFVLAGDNSGITLTNFTVTIRPRILPRESGWYTIQATHIGNADVSYHVACTNEEYRQNNTNFYALKFVTTISEEMPANQYVRVEMVDATHMRVYSSNGHGVNQNCTSAKDTPDNTTVVAANPDNGTLKIGGFWNIYEPTDAAATEKPYIGQGSRAGSNTFTMAKANPEATYDIWTVNITGAAATAEVKNNARVVLEREENKGLKKVYNNGKFFVTQGTTLVPTDFTADQYDDNTAPIITLNNEAKTVTVDYSMTKSSMSKCLELAHNKVEALYVPYAAQCIYEDGIVEKAKVAALAKIDEAAGERYNNEDAVSDETFQAISNATEAALTTDLETNVTNFNRTAVGKLIHLNNDRDGRYLRRLTVNANGNTRTENKDNSLKEIWLIASIDNAGHLSLQNYATGKYLNSANNNSSTWTTVETPHATNGYFSITPRKNGTKYPVDFHDSGTNNRYMHAKVDHNVIGWESDATTYGSAWLITRAEADEVADAIESAPSYVDTHKISFTHPNGLTLRSDITYLPCHNIIVTKIDTSADTEEPQTRTADASFEPITIAPTDLTPCENGYTAELNTKLGEGTYAADVPAALFLIGSGNTAKISKAYNTSFSVSSDGTTTGIGEIAAPAPADDVIHDLQGRRLATPAKGINIINGRKVLIR